MKGKIAVIALVLAAILAGGGIWYTQEYAYYTDIRDGTRETSEFGNIYIQTESGPVHLKDPEGFTDVDGISSPNRWKACFFVPPPYTQDLPERPIIYDNPTPTYGPRWYDCYDAEQIGQDLESGNAIAVLGQADIHPDIDRVLAIYPDGHAYGWHQYVDKTPERGVMD